MATPDNRSPGEPDLVDRLPIGRAASQLERSVGPSCLLSLIIVFLLLVVLRRYLTVSWGALAVVVVVTWAAVLSLLVRWRGERIVDD